jgi:DNA repair protein RadC
VQLHSIFSQSYLRIPEKSRVAPVPNLLCHYHPSGALIPSEADKSITKKIIEALKVFDCTVLDHIILTEDDYFSFADDGLMS